MKEFADLTPDEFAATYTGLEPASSWSGLPRWGTFEYDGAELLSAVDWTTQGVETPVNNQAIMYLLLILAMSVMAGATVVRAAKACFEGVWLARWKSAATPGYASRCGLHHVQTFGERIGVLHSSDGRALPYKSQDRLRKKFSPSLRRCCAVVQKLRAEHFVDPLRGGGRKGGSRAT